MGSNFLVFSLGDFCSKTLPYRQLAFLNTARRVEYSIIFFIAASTIKSKKDFLIYLYSLIFTLGLVSIYGIGQKFLGFPAVQTMNPAFSKGTILYLTPEARISSTFSGHYDLAAYLVFALPMVLGLYFWRKKFMYYFIFLVVLLALALTASRTSSVAYIVSTAAFLIFIRKFKALILVVIISVALTLLTTTLASRWAQVLRVKQIYINEQTGQVIVPQKISTAVLPAGSLFVEINKPVSLTDAQTNKLLKDTILNNIRDEANKSHKTLTALEEAQMVATIFANLKPVSSVVSDISFATRIQVEWPRAIKAFLKNPILGSGASSITEATDGDYFRWLGEFGLLGTLSFLYLLFTICKFIWNKTKKINNKESLLLYGFLFGLFGLMINASYIDVFEASKVAYMFWVTAGTLIGFLTYEQT